MLSEDESPPPGVGDALWDMSVDMLAVASPDGYLTAVNPSWERVLGYSPPEMTSRPYLDFVHPDDAGKTIAEAQALFDPEHATANFENRYLAKDGSYHWLSWSAKLAVGRADIVCVVRDVTEQVAARRELADSEQRFRLAMENSAIGMCLVSPVGAFLAVNPALCSILGREEASLVVSTWQELTHPDDLAVDLGLATDVLAGRTESYRLLKRYLRPDGTVVWGDLSVACVRDSEGSVRYFISQIMDVTDSVAANEALAERERRYRLLAETATDIVAELDTNYLMLWVTPSVESVLGWRPEELIGTSVWELVHPVDREQSAARRDAMARAEPRATPRSELRMLAADGSYRWMSAQTRRTDDADGSFSGAIVGLRDVHEEVMARLELADSERRYRLVAENATDMVTSVNPAGAITWVSLAAQEVLGYDPKDLVGTNLEDLVHPEDESTVFAIRSGSDQGHTRVHFETRMRTADGPYRWMSGVAGPDLDADGIVVGRIVAARDVQATVQARQALEASENHYRLLAENATDMVYLVDPAGVFTWVSPAVRQVLGYEPAELVGTQTADLVHPDEKPVVGPVRERVEGGEAAVPFEVRLRHANGEYRWASGVTGPSVDADGIVVGRIAALRDTHEQVLARQALTESEHLFHLAMDGAPQGMAVVGLDLGFLQVNPALCKMLGRDQDWLLAHAVGDVMHPDDLEADLAGRDGLLAGAAVTEVHERRWLTAEGSILWVMHSTGLLRDEAAQPIFYVSHVQDNTDAHHIREALAHRAHHDPLTGLINRDKLQEHISEILTLRQAARGVPALLFCDLDYFKRVNDTHGHAAGDEVLVATAERVASALRAGDVVARLGGDEFVVFLTEVPDVATAVIVAEKVRAAVSEPMPIGDGQIDITTSVGIALAEADVDASKLLGNADAALYEAKQSGRDRIATFNGDQSSLVGGPASGTRAAGPVSTSVKQ